jgi:hypothetical protein
MRAPASLKLFLVWLLCMPSLGLAQATADCDELKIKIGQLEMLDTSTMSPSIRQLFKESSLKLYTQYSQCIQRDISATTSIQKTVAGTEAAQAVEDKLRTLNKEKSDADAKIALLRESLNLAAPAGAEVAAASPPAGATSAPPAQHQNGSNVDQFGGVNGASARLASPTPPQAAAIAPCAPAATYADAPDLLTDAAERSAADVVRREAVGDAEAADSAVSSIEKLILYTLFDAASPASSKAVRGLTAYQYLGETARTDKQLGAAAKSEGAVSAIEKPGFARLLGLAIEHGGIARENDGTNLTLSTSLYSLYTLRGDDTPETYERAGVLNRLGVSASFAVENKNNELANARRNNLSEWSGKLRLFGDRSTRSRAFQRDWDEKIRPAIRGRLVALGVSIEGLSQRVNGYPGMERRLDACLLDAVKKRMTEADYKAATADGRKKLLSDIILGRLKSNIFDRVKSGQITLKPETVELIEQQYLPDLKKALDNLIVASGFLEKRLDDLKKGPLGTFAYTNYRTPVGSGYSETKFLWEQDKSFLRPLKLTGNFGFTFYHRPDASLQQDKVRDVTAALSFDGTSDSPFTEAENQSRITYSFVGRYERLFENRRRADRKPDIATAQFVMEIPFLKGFSLPLSLTYSNATEEQKKKNMRFNYGFRLDTDKLLELLRAPARQ